MAPSGEVQLVVPMAGLGTRFSDAGYDVAKPLLPVHGQPMFLVVIANLITDAVGKVVVIAQESFGLGPTVAHMRDRLGFAVELIEINHVTGGPADTVALARDHLELHKPVVTANSDQYVDHPLEPLYRQLTNVTIAGSILTMKDDDPKWSYAASDAQGNVSLVREKEVISDDATVGIYGFRTASLMWEGFDGMREAHDTVNGEYYVAPSYNHLISRGHRILTYDLGPITATMHGMGIPVDYEAFLRHPASKRAAEQSRILFGEM